MTRGRRYGAGYTLVAAWLVIALAITAILLVVTR